MKGIDFFKILRWAIHKDVIQVLRSSKFVTSKYTAV